MPARTFIWAQREGILYDIRGLNFVETGHGYSGLGDYANRPEAQHIIGKGPIPRGDYRVGAAYHHPRLGKFSLPLKPFNTNEMFGRSGFFVHGDNAKGDRSASSGCIILNRWVREQIAHAVEREPDGVDILVVESVAVKPET